MNHIIYIDGNPKRIAWVIESDDSIIKEKREQSEIYLGKITNEQAKFVALHVGIFWGIGVYIIKNNDSILIKIDSKSMYEHLTSIKKTEDKFVQNKTKFINQLIAQRSLKIEYELVIGEENLASNLL